ncbi:hypothetical protein [Aquimarina aggregata]|uniref:hypothetical protein n=1 Tax=Aquimarina aggregata TaxID=1642818 RepID=UPI0024902D93|nr:hypothetical protein [Aquimarina aggregata]
MNNSPRHNVTLFVFLLSSTWAFYGQAKEEEQKQDSYITFLIRNQQGCTHLITLDESGHGNLKAGDEENYYAVFSSLNETYKEQSFKIENDDWNTILQIVEDLNSKNVIKTKRPNDAVHYGLFLNGTKKIDAYARKSEMVNTFKDIIQRALPFNLDYFCETYVQN